MFEKAPIRRTELDEPSEIEIRRLRKSIERPRRLGRLALACLTWGILAPLTAAHSEVSATMLISPDTQPIIHDIAGPTQVENEDKATVFIDGFGSQDGAYFAQKLTPAIQAARDSEIYALEYGNRSVDIDAIARTIAETIPSDDSVALYGYSIGGLVAIDTAIELKSAYNIDVDEIFLDHTPMDSDSVRAKMRSKAQLALNLIATANTIGIDVENSGMLRWVAGLAFKDVGYMDATTKLMEDQYLVTLKANTQEDFKTIGAFDGTKPTIVYLPSTDRSSDYMVDDARSEKEMIEYAHTNDLPFLVLPVENAVHSRPDLTVSEYVNAMKNGAEALAESHANAAISYRIESGQLIRFYSSYK